MAQQRMLIGHVKGDTGDPGAVKEATATVDNGVGEPSVEVRLSGEDNAKKINFDFKNLKGDTGERGEQGVKGDTGNGITSIEKTAGTGDPGTKDTYTIHFDSLEDTTFDVYNGQDGNGVYHVVTKGADGLCPRLPDDAVAESVFLDDTASWSDPTASTASVDGLALTLAKLTVEKGVISLEDLPERYQARVQATMEPSVVEVSDLPQTIFSEPTTVMSSPTKEES